MDKRLHIVCLDVPYPPDYGGVVDLFYKIKYLHKAGVKIILHCFNYGRGEQPELENYCEEVHYYSRNKRINFRLPYIVSSRRNKKLLSSLLADDAPILLEGIHCSYYLFSGDLKNRNVWVRLHNVEYKYYKYLAKNSTQLIKKIYFLIESRLLKKYESALAPVGRFMAVNKSDIESYDKFHPREICYLPVFLPFKKVSSLPGKGDFCLYHGNLSVSENEKAAEWLIKNIFSKTKIPFVIAGKNPSTELRNLCKKFGVKCIANPAEKDMEELIQQAHIHLLPSFNATGIKIKLLNALFEGRFIITNVAGIEGTGFEQLCYSIDSIPGILKKLEELFEIPFSESEIEKRNYLLFPQFDAEENAQKLIKIIFN